jgi:hypothetical protein
LDGWAIWRHPLRTPQQPFDSKNTALSTTILILDDDLGFLFWLAEALGSAGYQVVGALNVAEARRLESELASMVDLLIVNPALQGAEEFVRRKRRGEKHLRVIVIEEEAGHSIIRPPADATQRRPDALEDYAAAEWLGVIRRVFSDRIVSKVPAFYSIHEATKLPASRIHHNNSACLLGRDIPPKERLAGTGGYRLCDQCARLNDPGR